MLNEEKILMNSKLAVVNTHFLPMLVGCIILSTIYMTAEIDVLNILFGWIFIGLACSTFWKYYKAKKIIMEDVK